MSRYVTVAATQMPCGPDRSQNIAEAEKLVREAASKGAQIILLQELFETIYFCQVQNGVFVDWATQVAENPAIRRFQDVAKELSVVLPISFFEKKNTARYNSIAVIDADGKILGIYRKSHIPDGPGYSEKFYFSPGDTGFRVWKTKYATIGVGICWDQWFPEAARAMVLQGAEILFYPTAIGSEPKDPSVDSKAHWQTVMQGHAAANLVPLVASNRIGVEEVESSKITFYGSSLVVDECGQKVCECGRSQREVVVARFDLERVGGFRARWGIFRDRRPDLYLPLLSLDGTTLPFSKI